MKPLKCWVYFYDLHPLTQLNSRHSPSSKPGALLKVEFKEGLVGYSDYHRWCELADCNLFEKLQYMRNSRKSVEFQHSVDQAQIDAQFRYENRSGFDLFRHIEISNHYLISDIINFSKIKFLELEAQGYRRFKVKMGRKLSSETRSLKQLCTVCGDQTQFRLDFNESLKAKSFRIWLEKNLNCLDKIDFIEDPISFKASQWESLSKEFSIRLALDMAADPLQVDPCAFEVLILKPAIQNVEKIMERYKNFRHSLVLTHYMDHPVGQSIAGWWACWAMENFGSRVMECGLQSRGVFEESLFSLDSRSPRFVPPKGLGWGFDELLSDLDWRGL